jgi:hypothetical protein
MQECGVAAVIGMQRYRVVVVPLKTVSEVKSAGGVLRNRISADPPLPLGWITHCSGQRDSLAPAPRQPQQQHSTSTSTGQPQQQETAAAGDNSSSYPLNTLLPDIRSSTSTGQHSTSATSDPRPTLDHGSAGAAGAEIPERRSTHGIVYQSDRQSEGMNG